MHYLLHELTNWNAHVNITDILIHRHVQFEISPTDNIMDKLLILTITLVVCTSTLRNRHTNKW